jgi:uncharacterized protein
MKIVLDTNVFISGIFFSGPPSRILKAWQDQKLQIVISTKIINEYRRVAEEFSSKYHQIDILPIIELVTIHSQIIDTEGINITLCEDSDDDKFIECALAGKCNIIVSGDKHLLKLKRYKNIMIMKPSDFVAEYL